MELYLLRHAIAEELGNASRDADRALTEDGRKRMIRATKSWDALGVSVDGILTSPYVRAVQTAEIAGEALGIADRIETVRQLSQGATPNDMVKAIAERCNDEARVMVVGHEPDLGRLISLLVCGDDDAGFRVKKAGMTKLFVDGLEAGRCAMLEWHVWPRHMLRMA